MSARVDIEDSGATLGDQLGTFRIRQDSLRDLGLGEAVDVWSHTLDGWVRGHVASPVVPGCVTIEFAIFLDHNQVVQYRKHLPLDPTKIRVMADIRQQLFVEDANETQRLEAELSLSFRRASQFTAPYSRKAGFADFIASKAVSRDGGERSMKGLQLIDTAVRRLEKRGCRNHKLPGYSGVRPLEIVTNDDLRLHHLDSDSGRNIDWLAEYQQYATMTTFGVLAIVDSPQSLEDWLCSGACYRETAHVPPGRLWICSNDGHEDTITQDPRHFVSRPSLVRSAGIALSKATRMGKVELVKRALASLADPNDFDERCIRPLTYAAGIYEKDHEVVQLLLNGKADMRAMSLQCSDFWGPHECRIVLQMFEGTLPERAGAIAYVMKDTYFREAAKVAADEYMRKKTDACVQKLEEMLTYGSCPTHYTELFSCVHDLFEWPRYFKEHPIKIEEVRLKYASMLALPLLRFVTDCVEKDIQIAAAECLSQLGTHAAPAVPKLIKALQARGPGAYLEWPAAARALHGLGQLAVPSVPDLAYILQVVGGEGVPQQRVEEWQAAAMSTLISLGAHGVPALVKILLESPPENVEDLDTKRLGAARALALLGTDAITGIPALMEVLENGVSNDSDSWSVDELRLRVAIALASLCKNGILKMPEFLKSVGLWPTWMYARVHSGELGEELSEEMFAAVIGSLCNHLNSETEFLHKYYFSVKVPDLVEMALNLGYRMSMFDPAVPGLSQVLLDTGAERSWYQAIAKRVIETLRCIGPSAKPAFGEICQNFSRLSANTGEDFWQDLHEASNDACMQLSHDQS